MKRRSDAIYLTEMGAFIARRISYATLAQRIAVWIKGPKQMKALNKVFGSLFMLVGALLASARHA